jgi:hypothetical protein
MKTQRKRHYRQAWKMKQGIFMRKVFSGKMNKTHGLYGLVLKRIYPDQALMAHAYHPNY